MFTRPARRCYRPGVLEAVGCLLAGHAVVQLASAIPATAAGISGWRVKTALLGVRLRR